MTFTTTSKTTDTDTHMGVGERGFQPVLLVKYYKDSQAEIHRSFLGFGNTTLPIHSHIAYG